MNAQSSRTDLTPDRPAPASGKIAGCAGAAGVDLNEQAHKEHAGALLGLALQSGARWAELKASFGLSDLWPEHAAAVRDVWQRDLPPEAVPLGAVSPEGMPTAVELVDRAPMPAAWAYHAGELRKVLAAREARLAVLGALDRMKGCGPDATATEAAALRDRLAVIDSGAKTSDALLTVGEILDNPPPPRKWILGGVVAQGSLFSLCGMAGTGKTRILADMAVAWATGAGQWGGLYTCPDPLRVLFISPESSPHRIHADLSAMVADLSEDERAAVGERIAYYRAPGRVCDFTAPGTLAAIRRAVSAHRADVVAFDPLNEFSSGDLNADADMREAIARITGAAWGGNPEAAVCIVHHGRTGGKAAAAAVGWERGSFGRNSKALYAAVRCQLNVAPMDPEGHEGVVLACGKSNDARPFATRGLRLDERTMRYRHDPTFDLGKWQQDAEGVKTGRPAKPPVESYSEQAVNILLNGGAMSAPLFMAKLHTITGGRDRGRQLRDILLAEGKVVKREKRGRATHEAVYGTPEQVKALADSDASEAQND